MCCVLMCVGPGVEACVEQRDSGGEAVLGAPPQGWDTWPGPAFFSPGGNEFVATEGAIEL